MFKLTKMIATAMVATVTMVAASAHAVVSTPFATPLSGGDSTFGSATAMAFEDFGMTTLSFTAADDLRAEISYTINPFLADLQGTPANTINLAYSINGGTMFDLAIDVVNVGVGTVGAGGLFLDLMAGDVVSFFITGLAGQSGNQVTFAIETDAVPVPAALPLMLVWYGWGWCDASCQEKSGVTSLLSGANCFFDLLADYNVKS